MKRVLFAGSFDPPTVGHLDLIERSARLCDHLYVAVAENRGKSKSFFSVEERISLLRALTDSYSTVEVISFSGLVVDCAKTLIVDALVRGVRGCVDLDFEMQMATANRQMTGIETVILLPSAGLMHISGTLIREIASQGHRLHGFVPEIIESAVFERLSKH